MRQKIKNILLEYVDLNKYKKFKSTVYRYIDEYMDGDEFSNMDENEKMTVIPYNMMSDFNIKKYDAITFLFLWCMDKGKDPLEFIAYEELIYDHYAEDLTELLTNIGWYDRYIKDPDHFPQNFNDIERKGDKVFLVVDRYDELPMLFSDDDRDTVERVLGEDWADLYGYFEVDFSGDVVDNMDEKSIKHVQDYIKENDFIGKVLDYDEYGDVLTEEMVDDSSVLMELIGSDEVFGDIYNDLKNYYRDAYSQAGEDEIFGELNDEIVELLGGKGEWVNITNKDGNDSQHLHFDITDIYYEYMVEAMKHDDEMPGHNYNDYITMLSFVLDEKGERLRTPDMGYFYPDSEKTEEYFNYNIQGNL